eukprot:860682-Amphidinium_carterae.2
MQHELQRTGKFQSNWKELKNWDQEANEKANKSTPKVHGHRILQAPSLTLIWVFLHSHRDGPRRIQEV